ncbi:MAG: putative sulfate/molybdate transporter [Deltaproteobacteria bacterium]|nr:putative sulfate/molybdate transporter [Deltaproteobacteria bacterium]
MELIKKMATSVKAHLGTIRFDRNELSGAFGDIGTDLPLIIGMIVAAGLDSASVLIMFGVMQLLTGFIYRIPMPVQPLKAMAAIVISQNLPGNILYGGGLAIGITMLLLTVTGSIDWLGRVIPKSVIRGIQFGLGLKLASIALKNYLPADSIPGYWLAAIGFVLTIFLIGNRRYPPAIFVIILGMVYAFFFKLDAITVVKSIGFSLPNFYMPTLPDILTGFVVLALPQIPLSLGNSIFATRQMTQDLFPDQAISVRKISFTYSLINLINPFLSGIPICHGSGGMAGHYAFGARTGGSVVIYGLLYLLLGFFFSGGFGKVIQVFPLPILGVILLFEGLTLMMLIRDVSDSKADFSIVLLVGLMAGGLPYGFVIGLIVGTLLAYLSRTRLTGLAK